MKNAGRPWNHEEAAADMAFFITPHPEFKNSPSLYAMEVGHMGNVLDILVHWAMKSAVLAAAPYRQPVFPRFSSPC
jgi:hypothetical protein